MIHVRHTSSAELARRRIRLAVKCLPCGFAPCAALALWAWSHALLVPGRESGCHFQGVLFEPEPAPPSAAAKLNIQVPRQAISSPQLLVQALPESTLPEFELPAPGPDDQEREADASLLELASLSATPPAASPMRPTAAAGGPRQPLHFTPPACLNCPQPSYPPRLRQRRVEGTVGVRITVAPDGTPSAVDITTTSGNAQLDRHTRSWILQHWHFSPARKNNHPIAAVVETQVHFLLHS